MGSGYALELSSSIILSVSETSSIMAAAGACEGRVGFTIGTATRCIFSWLALAEDEIIFNSTESGFLFFLMVAMVKYAMATRRTEIALSCSSHNRQQHRLPPVLFVRMKNKLYTSSHVI